MLLRLFTLFMATAALELFVLLELARHVGVWITIGIILGTALLGALTLRNHGFRVITRMRMALLQGIIPTDALLDGVLVMIAGVLLIAPGVLTDLAGMALLVPQVRTVVKRRVKRAIRARHGTIDVSFTVKEPSAIDDGQANVP